MEINNMKINNILLKITIMLFVMLLSACDSVTNLANLSQCFDADDFGMPKKYISSKGYNVKGDKNGQFSEWFDSDLTLDGSKLIIVVATDKKSYWNPWYSTMNTFGIDPDNAPICNFINNNVESPSSTRPDYAGITNAPCILKQGIGLYGLITKNDGINPNRNYSTIIDPEKNANALTFHLGANTSFKHNNQPTGGYEASLGNKYMNGKLYFRISDHFYDDNNGSYKVIIKSGAKEYGFDITSELIKTVRDSLKNASNKIYTSVIQNNEFIKTIRALLVLFIIANAFGFIMGLTKLTVSEFVINSIKIALILTLISNNSWDFFYNKFLFIFIDGTQQLLSMTTGNSYDNNNFHFIDEISNMLLSPEIAIKIIAALSPDISLIKTIEDVSLLLSWGSNIAFFFIILIVIIMVFVMVAYAVILYLIALIVSSLLITVAPLFIPAILFNHSREYFMKWISQLISYMLQPVLLLTFLSFSSNILIAKLKQFLGFKVCALPLAKEFPFNLMYIFKPTLSTHKDTIPVPHSWTRADGYVCKPYECTQERYVDMPFLNPNDPVDAAQIAGMLKGQYLDITAGITILIWTIFLYSIFKVVPYISRGLASGIDNVANSFAHFDEIVSKASTSDPLSIAAGAAYGGAKKLAGKGASVAGKKLKNFAQDKFNSGLKGLKKRFALNGLDSNNKDLLPKDLDGKDLGNSTEQKKDLYTTLINDISHKLEENGINPDKITPYLGDYKKYDNIKNILEQDHVTGIVEYSADKMFTQYLGDDNSTGDSNKKIHIASEKVKKTLIDAGVTDNDAKTYANNIKEIARKKITSFEEKNK
jgi:type IV secretion system protein VirB6